MTLSPSELDIIARLGLSLTCQETVRLENWRRENKPRLCADEKRRALFIGDDLDWEMAERRRRSA